MDSFDIVYIYTSASVKIDSVQRKVMAQIDAMNQVGTHCKGLFFTNEIDNIQSLTSNIDLIPYPLTKRKYFNDIKQRKVLINTIIEYIDKSNINFKYLYLRYPGSSFELYKLSKKHKLKLISEHISKEITEILSFRNEFKLSFKPSHFLSYFQYQLWPIYNEKIWGKLFRKNTILSIVESNELGKYQISQGSNKFFVNPNGIDVNKFSLRKVPEFNQEINMVFLKGSTNASVWNGIDRLVSSIDAYKGKLKISLFLCGTYSKNEFPQRDYIILKGYLNQIELDELFNSIHLGVSTLALNRKGLNELAILKTREYLVRGIPLIYGYIDPDIEMYPSIKKYCFQVSNDDKLIDFDLVENFLKEIYQEKNHAETMNEWSKKYLDWTYKMEQFKTYLNTHKLI